MTITTDRDVYLGSHVTLAQKEFVRAEALRLGISMSAFIAWLIDEYSKVLPIELRIKIITNSKEVDVPLPLEKQ